MGAVAVAASAEAEIPVVVLVLVVELLVIVVVLAVLGGAVPLVVQPSDRVEEGGDGERIVGAMILAVEPAVRVDPVDYGPEAVELGVGEAEQMAGDAAFGVVLHGGGIVEGVGASRQGGDASGIVIGILLAGVLDGGGDLAEGVDDLVLVFVAEEAQGGLERVAHEAPEAALDGAVDEAFREVGYDVGVDEGRERQIGAPAYLVEDVEEDAAPDEERQRVGTIVGIWSEDGRLSFEPEQLFQTLSFLL